MILQFQDLESPTVLADSELGLELSSIRSGIAKCLCKSQITNEFIQLRKSLRY